jgi:hypothetical protein
MLLAMVVAPLIEKRCIGTKKMYNCDQGITGESETGTCFTITSFVPDLTSRYKDLTGGLVVGRQHMTFQTTVQLK